MPASLYAQEMPRPEVNVAQRSMVGAGGGSTQVAPSADFIPTPSQLKKLTPEETEEVYRQAGLDVPEGGHKARRSMISKAWGALGDTLGAVIGRPVGGDGQGGMRAPGGQPDGPVSRSELAAFAKADQASGGPKNGVDTPTVRAPGRQVSTGGRGNSRTKTSPSTTTGPSPVTAAPRSSDPNDSDTSMDPSLKEMKGLLDHYKDGSRDGVDLSPMMALADSWGGSHLLKGYERPMNEHDREKLRLGLTEQMAKRQSDLEWHRQRMQMGAAQNASREAVADTAADSRRDVADTRGQHSDFAVRSKGGPKAKPAPAGGIDPDEKALQGFYGKDLEGIVRNNYSGDPKNIGPAKSALHQAAWAQAQKGASDPRVIQHYPGLQDPDEHVRKAALRQLYSDSVQDQVYLRPKLPGMKWRGPRAAEGGGEEGGEGGN